MLWHLYVFIFSSINIIIVKLWRGLSYNTMLGVLVVVEQKNVEVESEQFICSVAESIKSEQNFDLVAGGCSIPLSKNGIELSPGGRWCS